MKTSDKRNKEKRVVDLMIRLYENKHNVDLSALKVYANKRIDRCPFMEEKSFCSSCKVHCYQNEYRKQMQLVMRYSGKRMLFYHPVLAIRHVIEMKRQKNQ
ncbi:MAG: nitrous oxide-stimulated promoter family protein [Erysipelotrichia bacterium]|nr:nitrous oxide-stimulated promoter family protein [Erysipelotrichia bacterium]NCC54670.1 nitrous oxide-stimulated promoter family protein [Erysipelotrichia bacterium]